MDRASKIAQEVVHSVVERSRQAEPPLIIGPMDYEAAFAERLRKLFAAQKKRKVKK